MLTFLMFKFCALYVLWHYTFCDAKRYVTLTFWKLYVLDILRCVQLHFVTLRYVTVTLCGSMLCSNTHALESMRSESII
jgi:hypothetical protein